MQQCDKKATHKREPEKEKEQHLQYARQISEGESQTEAYRLAFGFQKKSEHAVRSSASRLAINGNVRKIYDLRLDKLRVCARIRSLRARENRI